jgi:NTE family protein
LKIVATNIETGKRKVFTKWKISKALRASLSLPWAFVPYKIWNFYYVDWWVVNNLPIDVLKGKNIIWVSALKNIKWPLIFKKKFLWFEINTNFFEYNYQILHRTILLMMKQNEDKSIMNLKWKWVTIRPEFWDLDYYDYSKLAEFIEIGYKEAKKKLR